MTKTAKFVLLAFLLLSFVYVLFLPLGPDETYYWAWSRRLAWGYFDGPPMIAWWIRAITGWLGNSAWVIKSMAVVVCGLCAGCVYALANAIFNSRVAEKALVIFVLLPIVQATNIITTLDLPLLLFWCLTLLAAWQWLSTNRLGWLYLTGLLIGLGLLSKYTMVLMLPSLLGFLLFSQERRRLLNPHVYLAVLLSIGIFSPVLFWNAHHHWLSFTFQWQHGAGSGQFHARLLWQFVLSQLAAFNPIFFIALLFFMVRYRHCNSQLGVQFLLWPFVFVVLFFMYHAVSKLSQMNWTAPAYVSAAILLAYYLDLSKRRLVYYAGIVLSILVIVVLKFPAFTARYPVHYLVYRKFYGFKPLMMQVNRVDLKRASVVLSDTYQNASEAEYYLPGQPNVYILGKARMSQYSLWSAQVANQAKWGHFKSALYLGESAPGKALQGYWRYCRFVGHLDYASRWIPRHWVEYWCQNK